MTASLDIRRAYLAELPDLAPLFNAYRAFYDCPVDEAGSLEFLRERLLQGQCWVWVAYRQTATSRQALGFTLGYPTFCSLQLAPIVVLHDLFTLPAARGTGVAGALMQTLEQEARRRGCVRIDLTTAHTNTAAQSLYQAQGYAHDLVFRTYSKALTPAAAPGEVSA
ncbi:GNAT family N-acetyltransferase [Ideonella livida]|uniref:GNAT family N-acetyltransferase n=1 Tax=Ideonella livida TaxID=2707176 RepID=A0A7C9PGI2_9BURK|nr:GNAT family N-acetyltransferase [Ideonella livida]NDY91316.1 GNAT family N-acetyltransferase [Ideonella livida]